MSFGRSRYGNIGARRSVRGDSGRPFRLLMRKEVEIAGRQRHIASELDLHLGQRVLVEIDLDYRVAAVVGKPHLVRSRKRTLADEAQVFVWNIHLQIVGAMLEVGDDVSIPRSHSRV